MARGRVSVSCNIERLVSMRESGIKTKGMEGEWRGTLMEIDTRATSQMENRMAMAYILG